MRISRDAPPSMSDSVSASIHDASTTRLFPLIVTVNVPACSAGSSATFHGRPFTMTSTFIAAIPAARAAPRAIVDRPSVQIGRLVDGRRIDVSMSTTLRSSMCRLRRWPISHIAAAIAAISSNSSFRAAFAPVLLEQPIDDTSYRTRPRRTRARRRGRGRIRWSC